MDESNPISDAWQQEKKNFTTNLFGCRNRPTKDSVHDLRVAVKRIRSYLRFNEQLSGEKWKEPFLKITALFKSFGRLRDFDMALALTRQVERKEQLSFTPFKEYLCVNRSLSRKWAKQDAMKFDEQEPGILQQEEFSFFSGLSGEETCDKIIQLSGSRIKKVKKLSEEFGDNAHEIRKQLKDVYYWLKICPKDLTAGFINIKSLDRMLNYLGSWQDHFILRRKIKRYIKDLPKQNEEREALKTLEKKLETAQDEILKKAIAKWDEIINKKATLAPFSQGYAPGMD